MFWIDDKPKGYDLKILTSGDIIEVIYYTSPVFKTQARARPPSRLKNQRARDEDKRKSRALTMQRARSKLRRLISANVWRWYDSRGEPIRPKFFTMTFKENITSLAAANKEFEKFIKRLNRHFNGREGKASLKYIVVPEFQKRGAVHYHVVFFNLPYTKASKLDSIWNQGFIKINAIDKVDNVGAYVCKYMGKEMADERLNGMKCYWGSRGLLKPKEERLLSEEGKGEAEQLVAALSPYMTFQKTYEHPELGAIVYSQYNLRKIIT